jgi:hypothetical protein
MNQLFNWFFAWKYSADIEACVIVLLILVALRALQEIVITYLADESEVADPHTLAVHKP